MPRVVVASLWCIAVATASAPCALELRIDSTDVTSLFDATANATAVADDLAARAGGSLAQGAGCSDDLACVRDRLRAATIAARDRCAASQNTATSRCRKLDRGAICYVGLSGALRRRLASKLVGLVAPISTIDGANVVVHVPQPAIAVVFDESTTSASLRDAVQTFARSYALDAIETDAVEKEAEEALIATHVSWQLGSLESLLPAPHSLEPLWRLRPHTYIGVSNETFVNVAEFWLRRDEYFIRELATRFGASKMSLVDVGAGTGTLLLKTVAAIAHAEGCKRMSWQALDWFVCGVHGVEGGRERYAIDAGARDSRSYHTGRSPCASSGAACSRRTS